MATASDQTSAPLTPSAAPASNVPEAARGDFWAVYILLFFALLFAFLLLWEPVMSLFRQ